jgi:hypothetical protein
MTDITDDEVLTYLRQSIGWVNTSRREACNIAEYIRDNNHLRGYSAGYVHVYNKTIEYKDIIEWVTKKRYTSELEKILNES